MIENAKIVMRIGKKKRRHVGRKFGDRLPTCGKDLL